MLHGHDDILRLESVSKEESTLRLVGKGEALITEELEVEDFILQFQIFLLQLLDLSLEDLVLLLVRVINEALFLSETFLLLWLRINNLALWELHQVLLRLSLWWLRGVALLLLFFFFLWSLLLPWCSPIPHVNNSALRFLLLIHIIQPEQVGSLTVLGLFILLPFLILAWIGWVDRRWRGFTLINGGVNVGIGRGTMRLELGFKLGDTVLKELDLVTVVWDHIFLSNHYLLEALVEFLARFGYL